MKSIAKVLAPVTLALAAVSAQAGVLEIDYGFPQASVESAASIESAASAASSASAMRRDADLFLIQKSQGAVEVNPAMKDSYTPRSREEVRREAAQPRKFDVGYFA